MTNAKLERMHELNSFLASLDPDSINYGEITEDQTMQNIVENFNAAQIQAIRKLVEVDDPEGIYKTLVEGREVLAMNPFPWRWISIAAYLSLYDEERNEWVADNPLLYHKWLTKMLDIFEEEAKRQGKL